MKRKNHISAVLSLLVLVLLLRPSEVSGQSYLMGSIGFGQFAVQDAAISPFKKSGGGIAYGIAYGHHFNGKPFESDLRFQFNTLTGGPGEHREKSRSGLYEISVNYRPFLWKKGTWFSEFGGFLLFQYQDVDYAIGPSVRNTVTAYSTLGVALRTGFRVGDHSTLAVRIEPGLIGWIARTPYGVVDEEAQQGSSSFLKKLESNNFNHPGNQLMISTSLEYENQLSDRISWGSGFQFRSMKYHPDPAVSMSQFQITTGLKWTF